MTTQFDVAVVGLGPAGRTLAHRLALTGLNVLGVDPHPERAWPQTLSGWSRQLPAWLADGVVALTVKDPHIRAAGDHVIHQQYAVLDNSALQRSTPLTGITVEENVLDDDRVAALRARAPIVVDARGARPAGHTGDVPHQTAHGILVSSEAAAPVLGDANAVLMDWRPFDGTKHWGATSPSFLYAIPMPGERVLLEETCVAGVPGLGQLELRRRLLQRLDGFGLRAAALEALEVERVSIPLLRSGRQVPSIWRFGIAGAQNNPFTGYTFFTTLAAVDAFADRILRRDMPRSDQPNAVRRRNLHVVLNLSPDHTYDLFDAFGRLSSAQQMDVLDPSTATPRLLAAMTRQFMLMPAGSSVGLARAILLP